MKKKEIPIWALKGTPIWFEVRDKSNTEALEYLEGVITDSDRETKLLKASIKGKDSTDVNPELIC